MKKKENKQTSSKDIDIETDFDRVSFSDKRNSFIISPSCFLIITTGILIKSPIISFDN